MTSSETSPLLQNNPTPEPGVYHPNEDVTLATPSSQGQFARNLGALDGFALLVSIVIGSGVFSSPGPVDANVPSPGAGLVIWLLGGTLAWSGALTMAELGTALPGDGGIQRYLTHMYGEVWGYLSAWSWMVCTMPVTIAILCIVFVESVYSGLGVNESVAPLGHKLWSLLVLVCVTGANSISTRTSTRLSGFFVVVKLVTVLLLMVAGLVVVFVHVGGGGRDLGGGDWHRRGWFAARPTVLPDGRKFDWNQVTMWESLGFYSTALYGALWAYSGWDKANYVAAELRDPSRQLPLSIHTAIPTIILCYVAANGVYYVLLPWDIISTTDAAAVAAVTHLLGKTAAYFATILICLVIAGSALGNSFVAGRMTVAASNKGWIPSILGTVGQLGPLRLTKAAATEEESSEDAMEQGESPINALVLNTILSAVYILLGNMRILLTLNGLAEYAFFFLTVLGAIILRFREPDMARPVKPITAVPVLFAFISGFVLIRGAMFAKGQAVVLLGIWMVGTVYYYGRLYWLRREVV